MKKRIRRENATITFRSIKNKAAYEAQDFLGVIHFQYKDKSIIRA